MIGFKEFLVDCIGRDFLGRLGLLPHQALREKLNSDNPVFGKANEELKYFVKKNEEANLIYSENNSGMFRMWKELIFKIREYDEKLQEKVIWWNDFGYNWIEKIYSALREFVERIPQMEVKLGEEASIIALEDSFGKAKKFLNEWMFVDA